MVLPRCYMGYSEDMCIENILVSFPLTEIQANIQADPFLNGLIVDFTCADHNLRLR